MKYVPSPGPGMPATFVPDATPKPAREPRDHQPYIRKGPKQPSDTVEGCRENARVDSARAETIGNDNARQKYEHSAASWTARADLLQRIDDSHEARRAGLAGPSSHPSHGDA